MAAKKKPIKLIIFLAVLLIGGVYLYQNLGGMITRTAEQIAGDALGVKVNIGSIDVSLSDKKVTVHTLEIGNPPGYYHDYAVTAEKILVGLNTASSEIIDFKSIEVQGSVVNLEVNEKGMNLIDLKNLANRKEQRESAGSEQVRVIVEQMVIDASTINPSITVIQRDIASIRMPAIRFSNIGKGGNMEAGDVIAQVMTKYLSAVQQAATQEGMLTGVPGLDDVKRTLDGAAEGLKGFFR